MEIRKTVKKIAALGMGASMLGATIMGAMAVGNLADYPTKFVNADGKFDGLFVVGKNAKAEDIIGLSAIQTAVQGVSVKKTLKNAAKAGEKTTAVDVTGGYKMGSNDWYYNQSANQTDSILGSSELPSLFADGSYKDNEGSNKNTEDYTQNLRFQTDRTLVLQHAQDDDVAPKAGTYLYVSDSSNNYVWNYTLEFDNAIDFDQSTSALMKTDLEGTTLKVMGKSYTIVNSKLGSSGTGTNNVANVSTLKLLGGENVQWVSQGESVKTTVEGTEHTVALADVNENADSCGLLVDGQSVWVDTGTTETVNGVVIGAIEARVLHSESKDTDVCKISVGAATLELEHGSEAKLNEKKISDVNGWYADSYFEGSTGGSSTKGKWKALHVRARPDNDKVYMAPGDTLVDPVFGGFKVVFSELVKGDSETITFDSSGKSGNVKFWTREGKELKLNFKSKDGDANVYWGDDVDTVDGKIYLQGDACVSAVNLTDCKGAKFLVSSGSTKDGHLVKITKLDLTDSKISFEDLTTGTETNDKSFTTSAFGLANTFSLSGGVGSVTLTFGGGNTASGSSFITFTTLGSGYTAYNSTANFVEFQTKEKGVMLFNNLQVGNITATSYGNALLGVTSGGGLYAGNFSEYNDGDLASASYSTGANAFRFNATFDSGDDKVLEWGHAISAATSFGKKPVSNLDDDNQVAMTIKGTEIWVDDDSSKQKMVITHPRNAVYAQVYLAPASAATETVEGGDYTLEMQPIGVDQTKLDTEVTDAKSKNVIAIGGPCANAVVAELMGNPDVCDTALGIEVGQAVIKMFDNNGKMALVVAGQTADDTRLAAKMLNEYKKYALKGEEVVALTVSESTLAWKTRTELQVDKAKVMPAVEPVVPAVVPATVPEVPATK